MSRSLRCARKSALVLIALAPALWWVASWHRCHYQLPPPRPLFVRYNSSLRFDLLDRAAQQIVAPQEIPSSQAARSRFARANTAALRGLRHALEAPARAAPRIPSPDLDALVWVATLIAQARAEAGDLPEAARCALDAIELTARSGLLSKRRAERSEWLTPALSLLWKLSDRLDAATARSAVRRLECIERLRWTREDELRDALDEHEFHARGSKQGRPGLADYWQRTDLLPCTRRPLGYDFGHCLGLESASGSFREKVDWLWRRVRLTYDGPGGQIARARHWTETALAQEHQPWSPHRPSPPAENIWLLSEFDDAFAWTRMATEYALLRAHLEIQTYRKEQGRYPESPTLPVDPFSPSRAPLRYRTKIGMAFLYSVGPDGKEDGGRPIRYADGRSSWRGTHPKSNGDIVATITVSVPTRSPSP